MARGKSIVAHGRSIASLLIVSRDTRSWMQQQGWGVDIPGSLLDLAGAGQTVSSGQFRKVL